MPRYISYILRRLAASTLEFSGNGGTRYLPVESEPGDYFLKRVLTPVRPILRTSADLLNTTRHANRRLLINGTKQTNDPGNTVHGRQTDTQNLQ